jgi:hypothetical protein
MNAINFRRPHDAAAYAFSSATMSIIEALGGEQGVKVAATKLARKAEGLASVRKATEAVMARGYGVAYIGHPNFESVGMFRNVPEIKCIIDGQILYIPV